jgi:hypothetical protein
MIRTSRSNQAALIGLINNKKYKKLLNFVVIIVNKMRSIHTIHTIVIEFL